MTFGDGLFGSGTFGEPGTAVPVPAVCASAYEMTRAGDDILNDIQLARAGGTLQRYTDQASIARYRQRTFNRSDYVCETDAQIDVLGNRMLNARSSGQARVTQLTIDATDDPATWDFILGVDYGWRIRVSYAPGDLVARGGAVGWTREMIVQGVAHKVTPAGWQTELRVDDALLGAADVWDGVGDTWDNALWATEV